MMQKSGIAAGGLFLLTLVGPSIAAEQQFSCKGQVMQQMTNPAVQPKPIDVEVVLGDKQKMSIKTGDDKTLLPESQATTRSNSSLQQRSSLENISIIRAICFLSTIPGNSRG